MKKLSSSFAVLAILLSVFAVTFALAFVSSLTVDFVTAFSGGEVKSASPAPIPHLADNLKANLESAENPEFPFTFDSAQNPFDDRTNVAKTSSSASSGQVLALPTVAQLNSPASMNGGLPKSQPLENNSNLSRQSAVIPSLTGGNPLSSVSGSQIPGSDSAETLSRFRERQRERLSGKLDQGDASSIYSVDDVKAIGVVGTKTKREVLFYSPVTKQTFSAPPGAKFRDGEIESVNETGVSFTKSDQSKTSAKWTRSSEAGKTVDSDSEEPVINQPKRTETTSRPLIQNQRVKPVISLKKKGN